MKNIKNILSYITICGLLSAGIAIILTGCTEDRSFFAEETPEVAGFVEEGENYCDECIKLRDLPLVTIECVDAYISVGGGAEVYKGTYCWISGVIILPIGGGISTGSVYHPNGYPSSQGGSGFNSPQTSWYFPLNPLQNSPIYNPLLSTLNLLEKEKLMNVIVMFGESCTQEDYKSIYSFLAQRNIKLPFKMDPTIPALAQYDVQEKTVIFRSINEIILVNLAEELIHAVQDFGFYGSTVMVANKKNMEFEAKVFRDLAEWFHAEDCPNCSPYGVIGYSGSAGQSISFMDDYKDFIDNIILHRQFTAIDEAVYQSLGSQLVGGGTYNNNLAPKVLKSFFGKPRPPKP